jgi:hypothetical protein
MYNNKYAYDNRRGQNPTLGIYSNYGYNPYSVRNTIEGYSNTSMMGNDYTLRVMPYDEDMREDFIDLTQPSNVLIYLLIAIIIILVVLYMG